MTIYINMNDGDSDAMDNVPEGPTGESCFQWGCLVLGWVGWGLGCSSFEVGSSARRVRLDRRRSRQRKATIGVFGFATVQSVRNALAGIERAT